MIDIGRLGRFSFVYFRPSTVERRPSMDGRTVLFGINALHTHTVCPIIVTTTFALGVFVVWWYNTARVTLDRIARYTRAAIMLNISSSSSSSSPSSGPSSSHDRRYFFSLFTIPQPAPVASYVFQTGGNIDDEKM